MNQILVMVVLVLTLLILGLIMFVWPRDP